MLAQLMDGLILLSEVVAGICVIELVEAGEDV